MHLPNLTQESKCAALQSLDVFCHVCARGCGEDWTVGANIVRSSQLHSQNHSLRWFWGFVLTVNGQKNVANFSVCLHQGASRTALHTCASSHLPALFLSQQPGQAQPLSSQSSLVCISSVHVPDLPLQRENFTLILSLIVCEFLQCFASQYVQIEMIYIFKVILLEF